MVIGKFEKLHDNCGVIIHSASINSDKRGKIFTTYSKGTFECFFNRSVHFVESKVSISKKDVLRGFHGDSRTNKLVSCLSGKIQLVIVNASKKSKTYGCVHEFELEGDDGQSIFIPRGYLNAHLCLTKECVFAYQIDQYYNGAEEQETINAFDPEIASLWGAKWKVGEDKVIRSERDSSSKLKKFSKANLAEN